MRIAAPTDRKTEPGVVGSVLVEPDEARVLGSLADQLQTLLGDALSAGDVRDTALKRLLPDAYRNDPELADEWRRLSRGGLVDRKIGFARTLSVALQPIAASGQAATISLTFDAALDWVRGIGDVRLVIADRMGITVDGDEGAFSEPGVRDVYELLAWMQDALVQLLDEAQPPGATTDGSLP